MADRYDEKAVERVRKAHLSWYKWTREKNYVELRYTHDNYEELKQALAALDKGGDDEQR